jgi:transglutaminase-like putative cysteine protease
MSCLRSGAFRWFFGSLAALVCIAAQAGTEDVGHIRFLKYRDIYHLNLDGTFVREVSETKKAVTPAAVNALGRQSFSYNSKLESFRLISAATLKADGSRVEVDASAIQVQDGMLSTGLDPSMEDYKLVVLTFPRLSAGDSVTYDVEFTQTHPEFKGFFDVLKTFSRSVVNDDAEIVIDAPREMNLRVESGQVNASAVEESGNRRIFRWHYSRDHIDEYEPFSADGRLADAFIEASNYPDYAAIGNAYYSEAKSKAVPSVAVKRLADELTAGVDQPLDQAHVLYDWVRKNIRYVATYIGAGGWVPHDAGWTMEHRYGDCKDHVTLLAALLAARGIDSETVLVNADMASFTLPHVPVRSFNHAITYLPRWKLYLDSTDNLATFGVLPEADAGRPVLHAAVLSYLARTSLPDASAMAVARHVDVKIDPDGSANVDVMVTGHGVSALAMRNDWQQVGKGSESRWLKDLLHAEGFEGSGSASFRDGGDETTLTASFKIQDYLRNTEAGAVSPDTFLPSPASFSGLISVFRPTSRALPYECYPTAIHDTIRYQFPDNLKILAVPKAAQIASNGFDYRSETNLVGQVFELHQDFTETRSTGRCEADQYALQRVAVMQIKRNVTAQMLYAER